MRTKTTTPVLSATLGVALLLALGALRGPLPAPAPAPLAAGGGTPIGSLPFTIVDAGTYYLTQNLQGVAGEDGITVFAPRAVIDLCGFVLEGVEDAGTGIYGVAGGVVVKNGQVSGWPEIGLRLPEGSAVRDVVVRDCGSTGMLIGEQSVVERCSAVDNVGRGIHLDDGSILRDTFVRAPLTTEAVLLGSASVCDSVTVQGGDGGLRAGFGSRIASTTVTGFKGVGIQLAGNSSAWGCQVSGVFLETTTGISSGAHTRVESCVVTNCDTGIRTAPSASVTGTTIDRAEVGIDAGDYARVTDCTVTECDLDLVRTGEHVWVGRSTLAAGGGSGLVLGEGGVATELVIADNDGHGLELATGGVARNNLLTGQVGSGLVAHGDRNRIADNVADANQAGVVVEGEDNLVTGNRAAANAAADFQIPYGNPYGPTINAGWSIQGSIPQANFRTPFP